MTRGYSLEQDLRLLINNPKYSDMEILCEDEKKFYGCRAILAARSEVFDRLLYNGMKETYENKITFPEVNSAGMEIILEYIYTGSIKEESLTKDNIIETFCAADYFQLSDLQDFIMKTLKNTFKKNNNENYSPELLSKFAGKMQFTGDNILLNLLVETVATISLNTIEFGRLSIAGLKYLLSYTYEKETPFATPEYELFRYSVILAAKQVSNDAYKAFMKQLPILEQIKQIENQMQVENENKFIIDHKKVSKELEPLIKFIDFRRIEGQVLTDIIDPLGIISPELILDVYRQKVRSNNDSNINYIRGIPILNCSNYVWDDSECGPKLIIEENGKVVYAQDDLYYRNCVRAKTILENKSIFEWDVIIERDCSASWVGVCASENFNKQIFAGNQPTGWVLGSDGSYSHSNKRIYNYCPSFGSGAKITVHLDMDKRTCAFTVNGTKYPEVPSWDDLPSKLYPVASLCYPGRIRIQPHI
ncbi:hypothetical protein RclHR1_07860008 [Rhizophagus clarus]|uniref:Concanavalin A-like lectin/glucanase domain-containing protein n=1 Tax=Rhizophagus clarus TaxID=94130 RepID=A0A2Z6RYP4_9GLOM|nr:hypothetical protein RclHR1_07860008 [Rhizophagus clarus]GES97587.1 concanavalin A-like lectin/glucanase domain-containing protein [Rhizophagus clarus]